MKLFKKHFWPEELGALIYEALRMAVESDGALSLEKFVQSIVTAGVPENGQYEGEVMVGLMFAARMAIDRSTTQAIGESIALGITAEFRRHILEQGATKAQTGEWEMILTTRFQSYHRMIEADTSFEPPWKLGRAFFWNVTGNESYDAMAIKASTLYLMAAEDLSQNLLNEYGPTLRKPWE